MLYCVGAIPYAEKERDHVEIKLSIQSSVDGRVDVDVCLFPSQLLNMCLLGLEAIIF